MLLQRLPFQALTAPHISKAFTETGGATGLVAVPALQRSRHAGDPPACMAAAVPRSKQHAYLISLRRKPSAVSLLRVSLVRWLGGPGAAPGALLENTCRGNAFSARVVTTRVLFVLTQVLPGILQKHCCILPDRNTGKRISAAAAASSRGLCQWEGEVQSRDSCVGVQVCQCKRNEPREDESLLQ